VQERTGSRHSQVLYREVNQRIREVSESFEADENVEFLCECGHEDCMTTLELTRAQFDGLLRDPGHVLLAAEHGASADGARILAEYESFIVVAAEAMRS
jgi:hypothetical protein